MTYSFASIMKKALFVRFSSLGDITQALAAALALKQEYPALELHWIVRSDFKSYLEQFSVIDRIWSFDRSAGLLGLLQLSRTLNQEQFDLIYDAHSNVRSHWLCFALRLLRPRITIVRRSKERFKRLMLFRFRKNFYPKPYRGALSFVQPLEKFLQKSLTIPLPRMQSKPNPSHILLAPSAAWEMKRWPVPYWRKLIELMENKNFVLLGGKDDTFLSEIQSKAPDRVTNKAGLWSWNETLSSIQNAKLVISGDTGVLHMADLLGVPAIALIGPTAFGYPFRETSIVLEAQLYCKPCSKDGRGKCINRTYKKCLFDISPEKVQWAAEELLEHKT